MVPWYRGFNGVIEGVGGGKYRIEGVYEVLDEVTLRIFELPIGVWTQTYKEFLEDMLEKGGIKDYKEYHTDTKVEFVVCFEGDALVKLGRDREALLKKFKLVTTKSCGNMVLFGRDEKLRKYGSVVDILEDFYEVRLEFYEKRKAWLEATLAAEVAKLTNKARFLEEVISGVFIVNNRRKDVIVEGLAGRGYLEIDGGYDYLLGMPIWSLTVERMEKLVAERDAKVEELRIMQGRTPKDLWRVDLGVLKVEWMENEVRFNTEEVVSGTKKKGAKGVRGISTSAKASAKRKVEDEEAFGKWRES
jgi:DNA topoisomerase-2